MAIKLKLLFFVLFLVGKMTEDFKNVLLARWLVIPTGEGPLRGLSH